MGLEYATGGKGEVLGRKIEVLIEDDQLKPDVSKQKATKLYADDKVDLIVGTTSSAAALAVTAAPGSWGGQRPSLAPYFRMTEATSRVTARRRAR
jgi:ABC-type branched-chain amino acid transport systems, periplasmic component